MKGEGRGQKIEGTKEMRNASCAKATARRADCGLNLVTSDPGYEQRGTSDETRGTDC